MNKINRSIFTKKKLNIFVISILILGVIFGAIFLNVININDQKLVIDKIKTFIDSINNNTFNSIIAFKNSISINLIYIIIIWLLGMTLIGIPINIFLLFIKSFILGFSISSFIITYSYKGLVLSAIYLLLGEIINILVIIILTIFSILFSIKLFKVIFKKNNNNEILKFIKSYGMIFLIGIVLSFLSSLCEAFIVPAIIKLMIKLFI